MPNSLPTRKRRVLVIDDDRVIRMVVSDTLTAAGFEVLEAEDAESGLSTAIAERPDVLLLDVMLPRTDGLTLLGQLRKLGVTANVIVFSATGSRNADRARELGAVDYISKPFELDELVRVVQAALGEGDSSAFSAA
jgi:DNA-binding response OmpR family regulator